MKKLSFILLLFSVFCFGCGESSTPTKTYDFGSLRFIQIFPEYPSIANNTTSQMTATGIYYDEPNQDITDQVVWASTNDNIATIDSGGLVSAHSVGETTITATLDGQQGTLDYEVNDSTLIHIDVVPLTAQIANGFSQQFLAIGTFSKVTEQVTQEITNSVEWSTLDPDIATIDQTGRATATGIGTVDIEALFEEVRGNATLTVFEQ